MIKRASIAGLIILLLFSQEAAFARSSAAEKIKKKFPHRTVVNLQETESGAFFFSFHPSNQQVPFRWHRWKNEKTFAETLVSSSDFSSLFRVAFSPDGAHMLITAATGEVSLINLKNRKRISLGTFIKGSHARYQFPAFSPNGKSFFLYDRLDQKLLMVPIETKNIATAKIFENVWLPETGGAEIESFDAISVYEFSKDGHSLTFGKRHVIPIP